MRKLVLTGFFILFTIIAHAQQIGMYSHYFYKPMVYNPAYTGAGDAMEAMAIRRVQWADFKGAPQLNIFTLDGILANKKVGLGLTLISDKKGISNRIGGNALYSYRANINEDMYVSFGVSFGLINQTLDYSKVVVENTNDPGLFADQQHKTVIDGNAGFVLVWNELEFGAAIPQILGNRISYAGANNSASYAQVRHYISSLKYKFFIERENSITIAPQGLVRFVPNTPLQYEGNLNFEWNRTFWVGATYKSDYALAANAGFCVYRQFSIGYSYDFILGNIGQYAGMSHEIMLNYKFGQNKKSAPKFAPEKASGPDIEEIRNPYIENDLVPELNRLISQQLLKDIESLLDKPHATSIEIRELSNRIHSFLESDFGDTATFGMLKKYYKILNQSEEVPFVTVKGTIILENDVLPKNFTDVRITLYTKETNKIIGIYTPNEKTGRYLLILHPGKKYLIVVKNKGCQTYSKDLSIPDSKEAYEMMQEIQLKK